MCINYRGLNNRTVKNCCSFLLLTSAFEFWQGAKILTKLDLRNGYHLMRIRGGDELKVVFNSPAVYYKYLVMPQSKTSTGQ